MYSVMRRLIFLLFTLLHTKITISILVQDHRNAPGGGYIYNRPSSSISQQLNGFKPSITQLFPSSSSIHGQRTSLSPLSFHPSTLATTIQSSNHFHPAHLPQSIHLDIPPTILHNFLSPDDEVYFADDGRLLKQYEVMERIIGDLEHPERYLGSSPLLLDSFISKYVAQNQQNIVAGQLIHPAVTRNHGPIALGSGSLGYIQLGNGVAHLGSGSLGYISGAQANQAVIDAKTRKALLPPGPLHFGHSFAN